MKISLIGLGCSGTLVLRELSKCLPSDSRIELLLFDESNCYGPGLPYGEDTNIDSFVLNMKESTLGANSSNTSEFNEWLRAIDNTSYGAKTDHRKRVLMGKYLGEIFRSSLRELRNKNISYTLLGDSVIDITKKNDSYAVFTEHRCYISDKVVMATGHLPKKNPFGSNEKYIANPYHSIGKLYSLPKNGNIGILGSKLTAVDMAIFLGEYGCKNIYMFSKSGRLPLVQKKVTELKRYPKFNKPSANRLTAFINEFRRLLRENRVADEYLGLISTKDALASLYLELKNHSSSRDWLPILDRSKKFIDEFWLELPDNQKKLFDRKYRGLWMQMRHQMPHENAEKIYDLMTSNILKVCSGYKSISEVDDGFNLDYSGNQTKLDYVIDASGSSIDVDKIDSLLFYNLTKSEFIKKHNYGGVKIDTKSFELDGNRGVYAIGQLTQGTIFYVSAIERIVVHSKLIAKNIVNSMHIKNIVDVKEMEYE